MGRHSVRAAGESTGLASGSVDVTQAREDIRRVELSSSYCGARRSRREARRQEAAKEAKEEVAKKIVQLEHAHTHETQEQAAAECASALPVLPCVTPSASSYGAATSYAEYMNSCFLPEGIDQVTVETPRRFTGLFSRSRVATAALAAAMLGFSGGAMAATGEPVPTAKSAATHADGDAVKAHDNAASRELSMADAVKLNVTVDGSTKVVTAAKGETVGKALSSAGIYLGADDEVSVSLSATVSEGMAVTIARVTVQTITEPFTAAFATREEKTSELEKGTTKTVQEGVNGAGMRTSTVWYRDGKEFKRDVQLETVTKAPQDKVVQVGTRTEVASPAAPGGTVSGTKTDWLAAAGIPQSDWGYADYIVSHESGWNPSAFNGSSGACGLVQALPCSKLGANWNDPVTALKWQYSYVNSRYGGYAGAYSFWINNGWY
ncbi:MAG: G5 domain-containing protein [Actinomycetaceae bacterium]|nr:G5 domain-containing protein [Arcanobacterium sp.]MDD7687405.1 G5 domain-containing protein [Actinomycetaceae bacterium]MDY5272879.1 G5 domain-containing protein [Arcanobacterium sp.]